MNLLLFRSSELAQTNGKPLLSDRRARHLLEVLKVSPGRSVRAGCVGESFGTALVVEIQGQSVRLEYHPSEPAPRPAERCLLLAVPRPKVLSRCLEHAAALGYGKILLFRSWRVEKSHLSSHKLSPEVIESKLLLGLEQARRVLMPEVHFFDRFKPFVEDHLDGLLPRAQRYVAHPEASTTLRTLTTSVDGFSLVIGPEGGLLPYEVAAFEARGFLGVRAETGPLRVESALSYLTGQLDALPLPNSSAAPPM